MRGGVQRKVLCLGKFIKRGKSYIKTVKCEKVTMKGKNMKKSYNIIKKILTLVLSLCIICLSFDLTYASSSDNKDNTYKKLITSLVKEFYPDIEPEIESVTPIYFEDNICEYAIDISYNKIGYGYIVLKSDSMDICRFVIDENTEGFCIEHFNRLPQYGEIVLKIDMLHYEIVDGDGINYVGSGSNDDIFDIFIDEIPDPMFLNFTMNFKSTGRVCRFGEDKIEEIGADYCCGVVAMLNVCGGYRPFNTNKLTETYNAYKKLWSYSDVKKIDGDYVMDQTKMGSALSSYYKDVKGKKIPYQEKNNPSIDFFLDAIDKKYSSILGVISKSGNSKTGHAVCVEGYYIFEPLNEIVYGKRQVFLSVASGWGTDVEYIWYDKVNVDSTYGVVFMQSYK